MLKSLEINRFNSGQISLNDQILTFEHLKVIVCLFHILLFHYTLNYKTESSVKIRENIFMALTKLNRNGTQSPKQLSN